MRPLDRLSEYLGAIERRMRLLALTRGAAVTAAAALALTILAVLVANRFSFSNPSVIGARVFLFIGLAAALAAALVIPVIRLNRRHAARKAEQRYPEFEERLLTFTERSEQNAHDPFLELLASDTLTVAQNAQPHAVAKTAWIFSFSSAAIVAMLVLIWLGMSGPGFLGYGTSLLWGGLPKGDMKPFYAVNVDPGNKTIRKRSDQMITATLQGFTAPKVRFIAKYASSSQWEKADMRTEPGGNAYQFLVPGVPESLEYYVEAGGVRSATYKLTVIDLPNIKKVRVTYHYPAWAGMKDAVEDPGGDLRAVEGTTAEVAIETDKPLANGVIVLDDGTKLPLRSGAGGAMVASVGIHKDGMYHFAAIENGEDVRLSEDYFIEAMKDNPPEVKITRPGRDFKASPIEEVTVAVEAKDDFALKNVELHYSVNGGQEKTVSVLSSPGAKNSTGTHTIALEDFKVEPGDIVSLYAVAKGPRKTTNTDMFFIEAQPFERNYTQSQDDGGGGGGGGDQQQNEMSQRQKEIITATWNQAKGQGAKGTDAENAGFLASVQSKLRDQAKSLGERMKARQLEGAGDSFKSFVEDIDKAVEAMGPAADKLKGAHWQDALAPEQKALQYLLRAEATSRDIQVAFGRQGGGGGGGGGGAMRDMQGLFDLEMDTEKNQYEGASRAGQSAGQQQQQQIDEMMQKLKELARRQQELADQQRRGQQTPQQRWEQEQLRREAEKLQQQMQQMMRGDQSQLSRGQQSQQSQQQGQPQQGGQQSSQGQSSQGGQMSQSGQPGQQQPQAGRGQQQQQPGQQSMQQQMRQQQMNRLQGADAQQMQRTIENLNQALQNMRQANGQQGGAQSEADARRAADSLNQAMQMLQGMRKEQSSSQVGDMARQAEELARKQQDFEGQMRRTYGADGGGVTRDKAEQLAQQKESEAAELKKLTQQMQSAVRDMQSTNRQASSKLRDALGQVQQQELERGMQRNADWIRRGMGGYAVMSEAQATQGLNQLRDDLKQVQQAVAAGSKDPQSDKAAEQALASVEQLRRQLEQMQGQRGQGRQGQQPGQRGQQPGQGGQQPGQQPGQGGQQPGQQQGQGGQQPGQQQGQGGQQPGQQQGQGGQQPGQQQGGGQQGGGSPQQGQWVGGQMPNGGVRNGDPWGGYNSNGGYSGARDPRAYPPNGQVRPQDIQQSYQNTMRYLQQLEQQARNDPQALRDLQGMIRDLRDFDPFTLSNNEMLTERIQAALAGVENVEMELRRKVEETSGGGTVRSPGSEKVPEGYDAAVAEYYRKLSQGKK